MAFNLKAAVAAAAATSKDMNVAQTSGGGDYSPPEKGTCGLRLVGYIELGKHDGEYQGKPKVVEEVKLIFELSGPKWEPKVLDNGDKVPHRITVNLTKSLSEKATFYKLFKAMNYEGKARIFAELLGNDYIGTIYHYEGQARADGSKPIYATFKDPNTKVLTIRAPFVEDLETGETKRRNVPPALTEERCFLWDYATKEMWDSIYIDGEYEEKKDKDGKVTAPAKSKNVFQDRIKEAKNFAGSPIAIALEGTVNTGGADDPKAAAEKVKKTTAKKSVDVGGATKAATITSAGTAEPAEKENPIENSSASGDDDDPLAAIG